MNTFQNGNSSKLPNDVSRCVTKTCAKRDICARFMDCQPGQTYSFCDFTTLCQGGEPTLSYFIPLKP